MGFVHRLSIAHKLMALAVLVLAAVSVPVVLQLKLSQELIARAEEERRGIAPARALMRLVQHTQQHRGLSAAWLGGNESVRAAREAKRAETERDVAQVQALLQRDAWTPEIAAAWQRADEAWTALETAVDAHAIGATDSSTRHAAVVARHFEVLDRLLDHAGLSLESQPDAGFLADAALVKLPHATESLGQTRARGAGFLAEGHITREERALIAGLRQRSFDFLGQMRTAFEKSFAANPRLRQALAARLNAVEEPTQAALRLAQSELVIADPLRHPPPAYLVVFTRAIDSVFDLENEALNQLERLLEQRVLALRSEQQLQFGLIGLLLASTAWLALRWWMRPLVRRVREVRASLERIGHGDYDTPVQPGVPDEFGAILGEVELMRRRLRATIADLDEQRQAAQVAERAKSEFLANMSHEIRTPLNAVIGLSNLTLRTELNAKQRDYLEKTRAAADSLLDLVDQVLDFSKIEAGRLDLELRPFELDELFHRVQAVVGHKAQQKGMSLRIAVAPEVPRRLLGDGPRVAQVLINLCNNAVKFTPSGRFIDVTVALESREAARCTLRWSVRDTGIGMSAQQIARLFRPFVQADSSTTRQYGGTGLGLAISRQLVEAMGGHIGVSSTPGVGSEFHFSLPLRVAEEPAAAPAAAAVTPEASLLAGLHVLLVEDNELNRMLAEELLRDAAGMRVTVADHGQQALDLAARERFDIVLMDVQMPGMDGCETTRRLRALPGATAVPVLAMTAHATVADRQRCLAAGMDDYLRKPFEPQALFALMARWAVHAGGEARAKEETR